jgi:hypothetical protein
MGMLNSLYSIRDWTGNQWRDGVTGDVMWLWSHLHVLLIHLLKICLQEYMFQWCLWPAGGGGCSPPSYGLAWPLQSLPPDCRSTKLATTLIFSSNFHKNDSEQHSIGLPGSTGKWCFQLNTFHCLSFPTSTGKIPRNKQVYHQLPGARQFLFRFV